MSGIAGIATLLRHEVLFVLQPGSARARISSGFTLACHSLHAVTDSEKPTMVGLRAEQRAMLIDKLPDAANLALGAMLFGQFLSDRPFSWILAGGGIVAWMALFGFSLLIGGEP